MCSLSPKDGTIQSSAILLSVEVQVKLPLEVGTRLRCRWRDGSWHDARIIERRPLLDAQTDSDYEYYVHYEKRESRHNEQPLHDTQTDTDYGVRCAL